MKNGSTNGTSPDAKRERFAVIGYGEDGRAHAQAMKTRGYDVVVAMLPGGMSWVTAVRDGFRPVRAWEATRGADVVVMLVPEGEEELLFHEEVAPMIDPGALLVFARGCPVDDDHLPAGVDVVSVQPQKEGAWLVTVHADATGRARTRAFAYAEAMGDRVPPSRASQPRLVHRSDPFPSWRKVL